MLAILCTLLLADPAAQLAELERLAGAWVGRKAEIVIRADSTVRVLAGGQEEFAGRVDVDPKAGKLTLHKGGEAWLAAGYRLAGDVLTLEIDGERVEYRRKK